MSCQHLLERMGYDCREVADRTIAVSTPFTFPDGEVVGFYIREDRDNRVILHDNADTLAHLVSMGVELPHRMGEWRTIKNIIAAWDLKLEESGIIAGRAPRELQPKLITNYISAILAIGDFEREQFGLTEEQADYIAQVEFHLKAWKPFAPFEKSPSVKGHSGKLYRFHFEFDGQLVEAARPHGSRTGSILRKSVDVRNAAERTVLVVMDDREDPDKAKQETDILTTMVKVMPYTVLMQHSESTRPQ
jgi:hypothetical protein